MKRKKKKLMTVKIKTKTTPAFINGIIGLVRKKREKDGTWTLKVSKETGKWLVDRNIAKVVEDIYWENLGGEKRKKWR